MLAYHGCQTSAKSNPVYVEALEATVQIVNIRQRGKAWRGSADGSSLLK